MIVTDNFESVIDFDYDAWFGEFEKYRIGQRMEIMCKYDEAFTVQEIFEETGQCKDCKLDCPNTGKASKRRQI